MQTKSHVRFSFRVQLLNMFCHFIIHCQFEHGLSHTRANGSGSEEPDSALSDDPTVQRNGQVWSNHNHDSRACSGGVGSYILTPVVNRNNILTGTRAVRTRPYRT